MSSNGKEVSTSPVATNKGQIINVPDLVVPANRIAGFVAMYKADYFEDHSLDWALDEIITRGMAEITRTVKSGVKRAGEKAAGNLLKEMGLSPAQAKVKLLEFLALEQQLREAEAAKAAPTK